MKQCNRCGQTKEYSLFNKKYKSKDGYSTWCKQCFADYDRERYVSGDKERKERNKARRLAQVQDKLWDILSNSVCANCGNGDPEVLEFDHRDQNKKSFNISEMFRSHGWDRIKEEIDKCDVLCANCHRKRTIKQLGTWRGLRSVG